VYQKLVKYYPELNIAKTKMLELRRGSAYVEERSQQLAYLVHIPTWLGRYYLNHSIAQAILFRQIHYFILDSYKSSKNLLISVPRKGSIVHVESIESVALVV